MAVAGSGKLGASVLEPLLASTHEIVAVVQNGRTTKPWRRPLSTLVARVTPQLPEPLRIAAHNRIPIYWLDRMTAESLAPLQRYRPDLLITCGFGIILKKPLLDLPAVGCINVHSSLLPRHRGPNPFSHAILQGDTQSGVTFHITEEGIDTGGIVDQASFPIDPEDNSLKVYYKSCDLARERVVAVVDRIEREGLTATPQDESLATYDPKLTPADLTVRWSDSAEYISRLVRASVSFGFAQFRHRLTIVRMLEATAEPESTCQEPGTIISAERPVRVATGDGILRIDRAFTALPAPWPWPSGLSKPVAGEILPTDAPPEDEDV